MKLFTTILFVITPLLMAAQKTSTVPLHGPWTFALDPLRVGERDKWFAADFASAGFDKVQVPHSYSVDKRYFFYTGTAWYFKTFQMPVVPEGYRAFLHFDAVFYKTAIWLNGQKAGEHEGGYTPFEMDVTHLLGKKNVLSMLVDNSWDSTTIPGAKTADTTLRSNATQLYAWMNYGGITRPAYLVIRPEVYIQNVQVNAAPDLKKGTARIQVTAFVNNLSATSTTQNLAVNIYFEGRKQAVRCKPATVTVGSLQSGRLSLDGLLPAADVKLWNQDEPNLYTAEVIAGADTLRKQFGIRKLEVKGTQLLLNGEPIRMGGCNRPLDYPGYGSLDPDSVLQQDLRLIKNGSMELSRISHYPVSESLLDWADKHGLLIIAEAGNWQMTPKQMADPLMRGKFQSQMKEMIERDWNHPSVIAYSLGNEFQSQTPEGKSWVKDMRAFVHTLDTTRLITFASFNVWRDYVKKPEDEASQYVDFISANIYGNHARCLQHIHEVYPGKPVYISEFGIRLTETKKEADRIAYFKKAMQDLRQCDYLVGASVWSFNDYMSRYPGTDADGYRAWGLVSPQRELRATYMMWQEEFAPATVELIRAEKGKAVMQVTARKDFPSYTLRNYQLRCAGQSFTLKLLRPGESGQVTVPLPNENSSLQVELVKPGGFVILTKKIQINQQ